MIAATALALEAISRLLILHAMTAMPAIIDARLTAHRRVYAHDASTGLMMPARSEVCH